MSTQSFGPKPDPDNLISLCLKDTWVLMKRVGWLQFVLLTLFSVLFLCVFYWFDVSGKVPVFIVTLFLPSVLFFSGLSYLSEKSSNGINVKIEDIFKVLPSFFTSSGKRLLLFYFLFSLALMLIVWIKATPSNITPPVFDFGLSVYFHQILLSEYLVMFSSLMLLDFFLVTGFSFAILKYKISFFDAIKIGLTGLFEGQNKTLKVFNYYVYAMLLFFPLLIRSLFAIIFFGVFIVSFFIIFHVNFRISVIRRVFEGKGGLSEMEKESVKDNVHVSALIPEKIRK